MKASNMTLAAFTGTPVLDDGKVAIRSLAAGRTFMGEQSPCLGNTKSSAMSDRNNYSSSPADTTTNLPFVGTLASSHTHLLQLYVKIYNNTNGRTAALYI
jgi:hypothetical protein